MLVFRIFTFVVYRIQRICARRSFALATEWGTVHTILATIAPDAAAVRQTLINI